MKTCIGRQTEKRGAYLRIDRRNKPSLQEKNHAIYAEKMWNRFINEPLKFNESTLTPYEVAAREGVDALEMDLCMTADGEFVTMHDETIDRITSRSGFIEQDMFAKMAAYPTIGISGREAVPRIQDLLDKVWYKRAFLHWNTARKRRSPIELLAEYGLMSIQPFSATSLRRVHELALEIPFTRLFGKGQDELNRSGFSYVRPDWNWINGCDAGGMRAIHQLGKEVHVFFTNPRTEKEEQKRVEKRGVDGFFTNHILYTKELLYPNEQADRP